VAKDDITTPPGPTGKTEVEAIEEKPETPQAESTPVTAKTEETPETKKKGANWIILAALIGLGVAAAAGAIFKKTV